MLPPSQLHALTLPLLFLSSVSAGRVRSLPPPTAADWKALNATVGGKLIAGVPFSRSCFSTADSGVLGQFDQGECLDTIVPKYGNAEFRTDTTGSFVLTQWERCQKTGAHCQLTVPQFTNGTLPPSSESCSQGSVPNYYIDVRSPKDVMAGLKFAKKKGIKPAVRSTGHDFVGRSGGPTQLAFWTHNLQELTLDKSFVPQGCRSAPQPAVRVGAGVRAGAQYAFAEANNLTLPAGVSDTVSTGGGYTYGGGHSIVSNSLGLAADRVLQYEVVTPTGQYLLANECQNSDLFFALNGAGMSSYGVILSHWTKALPKMEVQVVIGKVNVTSTLDRQMVTFLARNSLPLAMAGWGGYVVLEAGLIIYANPLQNASSAQVSIQPLKDIITSLGGTYTFTTQPSFTTFWNTFIKPTEGPLTIPLAIGSRLIPATNFATNDSQNALIEAMLQSFLGHRIKHVFSVAPFLFGKTQKGALTSVTPAWKKSLWHITLEDSYDPFLSIPDQMAVNDRLTTSLDILRAITPDGGAYMNEADVHEPNWQQTFWGSNYNRLLAIKKKYDPDTIFECWHCVGYTPSDPKYSCYI